MTGPATAMLLAARPRPSAPALPSLSGRSLLDRALDRCADASVTTVLIGAGPDRALLEPHLRQRGDPGLVLIEAAHVSQAVDRALADGHLRPADSFFLIDDDVVWFDGPEPALSRLGAAPGKSGRLEAGPGKSGRLEAGLGKSGEFDAMLLLARATENGSSDNRAAFALDSLGIVRRPDEREIAPFVFAGIQLLSASLFDGPEPAASLWDRLIADGRLGGLVHDGVWFHLPTEADIAQAEHVLDDRLSGVRL